MFRVRLIKIIGFSILASMLIPNNLFVYGTSDTNYDNTVSSIMGIDELQVVNELNSRKSNNKRLVSVDIAKAMNIEYTEEDSSSLIIGDELMKYDIAILTDETTDELESKYSNLNSLEISEIEDYTVLERRADIDTNIEIEEASVLVTKEQLKSYTKPGIIGDILNEYKANIKVKVTSVEKNGYVLLDNNDFDEWISKEMLCTEEEYIKTLQGSALLEINNPDVSYKGTSIALTAEDRDLLERLVMGEAGAEGYEGAALVAQAIRDTMIYKGYDSVAEVRKACKYTGRIDKQPNDDVLRAVEFIFDKGGYAVRHRIFYFYAFKWCKSTWHETQPFVIQHGGHRFFDSK